MWKWSALFRVAFPLRVLPDDQMRVISRIGAMAHMENAREGFDNFLRNRGGPVGLLPGVDRKLPKDQRHRLGTDSWAYWDKRLPGAV